MPVISPSAFASAVSGPASRAANDLATSVPSALREKVRRLERANSVQRSGRAAAVPLGIPAIDALLPGGGLLTGALHEIEAGPGPSGRVAPHDGAALGFAAHLLGRFGAGTILWCRRPTGRFDAAPYAPALSSWFDPARLLMVTTQRDEDLFWAMEEGLRCPGIAAVLGETRATDPTAGRRLSLAAEKNGAPALLLRAQPAPTAKACARRAGGSPPHLRARRRVSPMSAPRAGASNCGETASARRPPPKHRPGSWSGTMKRIVSLWFPKLSTDRLARASKKDWSDRAAATVVWRDGCPRLAALNPHARAAGSRPRMRLAERAPCCPISSPSRVRYRPTAA